MIKLIKNCESYNCIFKYCARVPRYIGVRKKRIHQSSPRWIHVIPHMLKESCKTRRTNCVN